jgi:OPA family glycerol-3-phosphate transporter-like MFS transporter
MYELLARYAELYPILGLLVVIAIVLARLPRVEVGHTDEFRKRRFFNWFPLGLTYAFLYMGRYNLNAVMTLGVISGHDYGTIFAVGAWVYGCSFLLNGPLADRYGGRRTILVAAFGSATMNALMALATRLGAAKGPNAVYVFALLYGANMYFQSFGAVSIIKVNSAWFHVRERGVFGGIFGILISLGLYFAFDWCLAIGKHWPGNIELVFAVPASILYLFWVISFLTVRDTPGQAGHKDFDPGDASSGDTSAGMDGKRGSGLAGLAADVAFVLRRMLANPIVMVIACIELCSGFMRDSMMHWYRAYAAAIAPPGEPTQLWVSNHWGMLTCMAGILGGTFAGVISDRLFHSRRPPVAAVLYSIMLAGAVALLLSLASPLASGIVIIFMIMSVLGVHGVLSGTASADFGGKKNAGVATGIIDGFVYAGVGAQSLLMGHLLPEKGSDAAHVVEKWRVWPIPMMVVAVVGLVLATRVWNARPQPKGGSMPAKPPRRADPAVQAKILDQAVEAARSAGSKGIVAFDLDSTLFDNHPRQAALVAEWARAKGGFPEVEKLEARHIDTWDLRRALVNVGLTAARAEEIFHEVKAYWRERFFTSRYCELDVTIPGATSFLAVLQETGVQIAYLTGRHEEMREGTVACMKRHGMPLPDGKSVQLIMKPTLEEEDDAFKKRAYEQLRGLGRVVAAFDNEPVHVNGYKTAFPDAHVVHLDTDDSGRPVRVLDSIPSVLDFRRA